MRISGWGSSFFFLIVQYLNDRSEMKRTIFGIITVEGNLGGMEGKRGKKRSGEEKKSSKQGNPEFSGCARASKAMRLALGEKLHDFRGGNLQSRMMELNSKVIRCDSGEPGKRLLRVREYEKFCRGFEVNTKQKFGSQFYAPFRLNANADRNTVTLEIGRHGQEKFRSPRSGCWYELVLAAGVVTDFAPTGVNGAYEAVHPELVGISATAVTGLLAVWEGIPGLTMEATLPGLPVLPDGSALLASVGIRFYNDVNGLCSQLSMGAAMKVVGVF